MPNVYFELRDTPNKNGEHRIRLVINTGSGYPSRKATKFAVKLHEWDRVKQKVNKHHPAHFNINNALEAQKNKAINEMSLSISTTGYASAKDISNRVLKSTDFYKIAHEKIAQFALNDSYGTIKRYQSIINKLHEFAPKLHVSDITPQFIYRYQDWLLKNKKNAPNTVQSNIKALNAIWKFAYDMEYINSNNPFNKIKIASGAPIAKEILTFEEIEKLQGVPMKGYREIARDMFMFSYYSAGMRFSDVLLFNVSMIKNNRIAYITGKNEKLLSFPLHNRLKAIIDKYAINAGTLFGMVQELKNKEKQFKNIGNKQAIINKYLQFACNDAGIYKKISFHCARHTFAHHANEISNRNVYSIKNALGHTTINTTEIYLGNDTNAVDTLLNKLYHS
jgi:site-specific recombinase XerD